MSRWFRFYDAVLDDPKVQRLPPDLFKAWVNILCVASKHNGHLPAASDLAFMMRIDEQTLEAFLRRLIEAGLVDQVEDRYEPHGWVSRQHKSDVSNERVKRFRERQRNGACNVTATATETAPDTDTDTELEIGDTPPLSPSPEILPPEKPEYPPERKKRAKARSAIPADWIPSEQVQDWLRQEARKLGVSLGARAVEQETAAMIDFHAGKGNVFADFDAAWRTWMRNWLKREARAPPAIGSDQRGLSARRSTTQSSAILGALSLMQRDI